MEVLWESPDPMTVRQVGGCLTDRDLAHTTVMTVLDRLAKKGFVRRQRAERRLACVGQDHVEGEHMVDRHAVPHRLAASRVVADHPAERGPVPGGGIRAEHQAVPRARQVQLFLHHPGLHLCHAPLGVDLDDPVHVPRQVHHDRMPDRLAGQAGPGAPRQHRDAELGGGGHDRGHVGRVTGKDHPDWLDRVHAGVAREEVPGVRVEPDFTTDHAAQRFRELRALSGPRPTLRVQRGPTGSKKGHSHGVSERQALPPDPRANECP